MPSILNTCRPRPRNSIPRSRGPIVLRPVSRRVRPMEMSWVTAERTSETAKTSEPTSGRGCPPRWTSPSRITSERSTSRFASPPPSVTWIGTRSRIRSAVSSGRRCCLSISSRWARSRVMSLRSCSVTSPEPRWTVSRSPNSFQDALALSAWKQAGSSRWSLRVNPSSGNLHPTEGYLVAGPIAGLHPRPAVYHYTPFEHALELRAELSGEAWLKIAAQLPEGAVLVGLTSIHWRESWKYGERAFRYCHHDAGHAIGSFAVSAAGLGWEAKLLESVTDRDLAVLLGVHVQTGSRGRARRLPLGRFPSGSRLHDRRAASVHYSGHGARRAAWRAVVWGAEPAEQRSSFRGPSSTR